MPLFLPTPHRAALWSFVLVSDNTSPGIPSGNGCSLKSMEKSWAEGHGEGEGEGPGRRGWGLRETCLIWETNL